MLSLKPMLRTLLLLALSLQCLESHAQQACFEYSCGISGALNGVNPWCQSEDSWRVTAQEAVDDQCDIYIPLGESESAWYRFNRTSHSCVAVPGTWPAYSATYQETVITTVKDTGQSSVYSGPDPPGSMAPPFYRSCTPKFYVAAPPKKSAQCGSTCNGVGDPINVASGAVYDVSVDAPSVINTLEFKKYYNSSDSGSSDLSLGWRHSFSRTIRPKYSSVEYRPYAQGNSDNSSLYIDEATACTSGFAQIKSKVSTWTNATASYSDGVCNLSVAATNVGSLPIYSSRSSFFQGTTLLSIDATRDDGQVINFAVNGSTIMAPPSIVLKLQQTSGGYTLTDANDNVEAYNGNGKLLSVTSRAGVIQTMSYASSGRLSGVTDNFGHSLTLSYDSQGRLSSVTR